MHPAALPATTLADQCAEIRTRRSGPGGQHRNKVETAVVLVHRPTGVAAEASERRSQAENRRMAVRRLRLRLATEHRMPARPQPSELWQSRTRGRQLLISVGHDDYPALVAEALDQLQGVGWQMAPAAQTLGVTTSQLVGLFKKMPAAWAKINALRGTAGLGLLK
ncbi:MAG: peptide chain release factor-like protein [Planctomycetia bacterium]|nr:peptide chain release factor-like protein [Planctomycetia bacterium]